VLTKRCYIPQASRQLAQEGTSEDSYLTAILAGPLS